MHRTNRPFREYYNTNYMDSFSKKRAKPGLMWGAIIFAVAAISFAIAYYSYRQ